MATFYVSRSERRGDCGGTSLIRFADLRARVTMQGNMEQRYAIKFYVKLKKTKQEAYGLLKEAYGDERMSQASFYRWFNRFSEGNEQVEDEPRSGSSERIFGTNLAQTL